MSTCVKQAANMEGFRRASHVPGLVKYIAPLQVAALVITAYHIKAFNGYNRHLVGPVPPISDVTILLCV